MTDPDAKTAPEVTSDPAAPGSAASSVPAATPDSAVSSVPAVASGSAVSSVPAATPGSAVLSASDTPCAGNARTSSQLCTKAAVIKNNAREYIRISTV